MFSSFVSYKLDHVRLQLAGNDAASLAGSPEIKMLFTSQEGTELMAVTYIQNN